MSKIIFSLFCLLGCLLNLQCSAGSTQELDGKFYVSPGSIYVAADAIYLNLEGHFVAISGISSDANGIYILNAQSNTNTPAKGFINQQNETFTHFSLSPSDLETRGIWGETWFCERCNYENYEGINTCGQCGLDR